MLRISFTLEFFRSTNMHTHSPSRYDGVYWIEDSRWVNLDTLKCAQYDAKYGNMEIPFSLVSQRTKDGNSKFPTQLHSSVPLGMTTKSTTQNRSYIWALEHYAGDIGQRTNLFQGHTGHNSLPMSTGGVIDMTNSICASRTPSGNVGWFPRPGPSGGSAGSVYEGRDRNVGDEEGGQICEGAERVDGVQLFAWNAAMIKDVKQHRQVGYDRYGMGGSAWDANPDGHFSPYVRKEGNWDWDSRCQSRRNPECGAEVCAAVCTRSHSRRLSLVQSSTESLETQCDRQGGLSVGTCCCSQGVPPPKDICPQKCGGVEKEIPFKSHAECAAQDGEVKPGDRGAECCCKKDTPPPPKDTCPQTCDGAEKEIPFKSQGELHAQCMAQDGEVKHGDSGDCCCKKDTPPPVVDTCPQTCGGAEKEVPFQSQDELHARCAARDGEVKPGDHGDCCCKKQVHPPPPVDLPGCPPDSCSSDTDPALCQAELRVEGNKDGTGDKATEQYRCEEPNGCVCTFNKVSVESGGELVLRFEPRFESLHQDLLGEAIPARPARLVYRVNDLQIKAGASLVTVGEGPVEVDVHGHEEL